MDVTVDQFNLGLEEFLRWGPTMSIPIEQRLEKLLPDHAAAQRSKLIKEYAEIRSSASAIVIDQLESKQAEAQGRQRVAEIDPRISPDNAAMLYTQARYSAWRDGYS